MPYELASDGAVSPASGTTGNGTSHGKKRNPYADEKRIVSIRPQPQRRSPSKSDPKTSSLQVSIQELNLRKVSGNESFSDSENSLESDIDAFLEHARYLLHDNNNSYDSASYRDFELLLAESIGNHFLDGDEDHDSLSSDISYSGYDCDSRKLYLEENLLISESSSSRLKGTIARKRSMTNKPMLCVDEESELSYPRDNGDKDFVPCSEDTTSTEPSKTSESSRVARAPSFDSDESTVETGTTFSHRTYDPLREFEFNQEDNSIVSKSSFQPIPRRKKRRFRARRRSRESSNSSVRTEDCWDNVEHTLDDLAFILAQEKRGREGRLSNVASAKTKEEILADLKETSEGLHSAVLERVDRIQRPICYSPVTSNPASDASPTVQSDASPQLSGIIVEANDKMGCNTPDKTYEADKSQLEIPTEGDTSASVSTQDFDRDLGQAKEEAVFKKIASMAILPYAADCQTSDENELFSLSCERKGGTLWDFVSRDVNNEHSPALEADSAQRDLGTILENAKDKGGFDLDVMIDSFLTTKMQRITDRMEELHIVQKKKFLVMEQVKESSRADDQTGGTSRRRRMEQHKKIQKLANANSGNLDAFLQSRGEDYIENRAAHDLTQVKGRELIRKVQSNRRARAEARQLRNIIGGGNPDKFDADEKNENGRMALIDALYEETRHESASVMGELTNHEQELEAFLTRKAPTVEDNQKRSKSRTLKVKRKSLLKGLGGKDNTSGPLHESMDDSMDGIINLDVADHRDTILSPHAGASIKSLRFGRRRSSSYEALPDLSFASRDMNTDDILQALAPPSPESPIRDYVMTSGFSESDTSETYRSIGDSSRSEFRALSFSGTDSRASASNVVDGQGQSAPLCIDTNASQRSGSEFSDSFDEIVLRDTINVAFDDEMEAASKMKKISPTSVLENLHPLQQHKQGSGELAFVDDEEADPLFVDEEDVYLESSFQQEMDESPSEFIGIKFLTLNRFEI